MNASASSPDALWPDDYVALDNGQLKVRADCVAGFEARGWTSLDAVMAATDVTVVRDLEARDNCTTEIVTDQGPITGYLKRHRVQTLDDWRRERGALRAADTPGLAEAEAIGWCRQAGVPTMSVIAAGSRRDSQVVHRSQSFFISEALADCVPAVDLWHDDGIPDDARRRALVAIARSARRFHQANLFHYDLYLDHFFVHRQQLLAGEPVEAHLMDLQRVERRPPSLKRWVAHVKDLGQFYGSCQHHGVTAEDWDLWLQHYFGSESGPCETLSGQDKRLLKAAAARWDLRILRRRVLGALRPGKAA